MLVLLWSQLKKDSFLLVLSRMESIFTKIPVLGDRIMRELDNHSLVKCKKVQRSWWSFINAEKIPWFRMIQNHIGDNNEFITTWRKILRKAPVDFVTQVALATQQYHQNCEYHVEYIAHSGISPIHVAASNSNAELFHQMMVKVFDKNQTVMKPTDIWGKYHPLLIAACRGNYDVCKLIIENADDKNPRAHDGGTPLFEAAYQGHYEICKLIISNVQDKNPARPDGSTPLCIAAEKGHFEICQLIIANVDEKNPTRNNGYTPLHVASEKGSMKSASLLLPM